jgi:glycolate oxidase FAD binding subunit
MVVAPRSVDESAAWLRELDAGTAVRIVGAGTNLEPQPSDAYVLSTEGLDWIDARTDDLTVAVGAGVHLGELQGVLEPAGLRIAVDPVADGTVGAMVATSAHGAMVWRYGGIRDLLIGATLVLADGTVAHSGGHVIKNVAGYDLAKVVCGARGRLALIAEVVLRAHPLPRAVEGVVVDVAAAGLVSVLEVLRAVRIEPVAIDWVEGRCLVVFEGTPGGARAQAERLLVALARAGLVGERLEGLATDEVRRALAGVRNPVEGVVLRVSLRASALIGWLERIGSREGVTRAAYPGAGLADLVVAPERVRELSDLVAQAQSLGARLEVRCARGGPAVAAAFDLVERFGHPLWRRIAAELDPTGRFQ